MTYREFVNDKIHILYDFCALARHTKTAMELKDVFLQCGNETTVENICHDILVNGKSVNKVLEENGNEI